MKSVYIHIPFCNHICSYCDFSKMFYNESIVDKYLNILEEEIISTYRNEKIKTIYIGGGTPSSLSIKQLNKLFKIIKIFKTNSNTEITIECNIENIDEEKLNLIKKNVNRISIGIQSFNDNNLKLLDRKYQKKEIIEKINLVKKARFENINVDLMYAFNNQTIKDLNDDIDEFLALNINHISTYSLMIEPNTKLFLNGTKPIDEDIDAKMYELICNKLKDNGYIHYEISNFAKKGYESKHNLTYWNNDEYYGFGMGASSYVDNIRYDNTKSINKYLNKEFVSNKEILTKEDEIKYELILGFRKLEGINKKDFFNKYNIELIDIKNIKQLIEQNKLIENENNIYINPKYIYISNSILVNFV